MQTANVYKVSEKLPSKSGAYSCFVGSEPFTYILLEQLEFDVKSGTFYCLSYDTYEMAVYKVNGKYGSKRTKKHFGKVKLKASVLKWIDHENLIGE